MPTPQQYKKLRDALISAFPEKSRLEQMLYFELGRKLNEITRDSDLQDITFKLIQTAEAQGWLQDLVRSARKENSGNVQLQAIAVELLPPEPPSKSQQKILVLADTSLDGDPQKIESVIKRTVNPNLFEIKVMTVVNPQDIRRAVGEERPSIVHFCIHGTEDGDLVLKDHLGNDKPVRRAVLAELFKLYADCVKCVLVNACYSFQSAKAISQHINYVISLEKSIQEEAAIVFAEGFYNGLGYIDINNSSVIARAFHEGIVALKLDCSKGMIPDLWNQSVLEVGDLSSDRSIDYTRLRNLLAAGNWKDADYETYLVMLQVVGRKDGDWIRDEELLNFPCTDLRTIDSLWVKYSNGRFGFSVQTKIYLEVSGKPDGQYDEEAFAKFGDHVGWRVKESWQQYEKVIFDTTAPRGHLPALFFPSALFINFLFKADICYQQGVSKCQQSEYQAAIANFDQAIQLNPQWAKAYYNRGLAYAKLEQDQKATSDYTQALQINSNWAEVYCSRGNVYYKLGQYEKAIADCDAALKTNRNSTEHFLNQEFVLSVWNESKSELLEDVLLKVALLIGDRDENEFELHSGEKIVTGLGMNYEADLLRGHAKRFFRANVFNSLFLSFEQSSTLTEKSILMNALLGTDIFHTEAVTSTASIMVKYGEQPKIILHSLGGIEIEIDIKVFSDMSSNTFGNISISHIEIQYPVPMLSTGLCVSHFHFLIFPRESEQALITALVRRSTPLILIFDITFPNLRVLQFLEYYYSCFDDNTLFVVNHSRFVNEEKDVDIYKEFIKSQLKKFFTDNDGEFNDELYNRRVFFVDALGALQSRLAYPTDKVKLNGSGIISLESELMSILKAKRAEEFFRTIMLLENICNRVTRHIEEKVCSYQIGINEIQNRIDKIQNRIDEIQNNSDGNKAIDLLRELMNEKDKMQLTIYHLTVIVYECRFLLLQALGVECPKP